jgi:hypothetical protein
MAELRWGNAHTHAMANKQENKPPANPTVERLVEETGITEAQARELVILLGTDWSSLIREAKLIQKKRPT